MRDALPPDATLLVTGASAGLGLALSRQLLATTRHRLILTARRESLPRFAAVGIAESERVWLRALDVTRAEEREQVVREAEAKWGGVDALVNNAGVTYRAVVEHATRDDCDRQLDVNFRAPLELIRLVLPPMREKRRGRVITVSSVGGMMAMPTMALYSASKFAIEGACESLWYEVRPWGIAVSLVEPGFIHSESFRRTHFTEPSRWSSDHADEAYHTHYEAMARLIERLMRRTWATPDHVARVIVSTLHRRNPPLRVPATPDAHVFAMLRRLLPRGLYHRVLYAALPRIREWGR